MLETGIKGGSIYNVMSELKGESLMENEQWGSSNSGVQEAPSGSHKGTKTSTTFNTGL